MRENRKYGSVLVVASNGRSYRVCGSRFSAIRRRLQWIDQYARSIQAQTGAERMASTPRKRYILGDLSLSVQALCYSVESSTWPEIRVS